MERNAGFSLNLFNKMKRIPPLKIVENNTGRNWCAWKQNFFDFLHKEDPEERYKTQWTVIFLYSIGPVGEQAYKNLSYENCPTKDLGTLIHALDLHFIFGSRKKQRDENVEKYIDNLMLIAISSHHRDPVSIVKEKIIQDIKNYNFTGEEMLFVQSKRTNLESYLRSLNFHQMTSFLKQCEELTSSKNNEDARNQIPPHLQSTEIIECARCRRHHNRNRCPAYGKQCDNCKGYNHFKENCRVKYVSNCTKCGTNHVQSRCLAYGKTCTTCGKSNHFSWLCQVPIVKDCFRCGFDHAVSMCPAQGKICTRCNKPNHLQEKCVSKLNDEEE